MWSAALVDFDDISYDVHADLLYDLAGQSVRQLKAYLSEDDARKVLRCYQRDIARFVHAQMQAHYWEEVAGLRGGGQQGLYRAEAQRLHVQKFDSDSERKLAVILERDATKWFKPAKGQFQIYYRDGADHREYQPDFVAETVDAIYMLEPKKRTELADPIVQTKKEVAIQWCANASDHAASYGGKPWRYVLIPHDEIAENITLEGVAARFGCS
jgi:type III restriction enzyme